MHSVSIRNKMFQSILYFALVSLVQCQINGEFWWLNNKLNNLKKVRPDPPKIDLSDFQNDESARIIFRDDETFTNNGLKSINDRTSKLNVFVYPDQNKVIWPTGEHIKTHDIEVTPAPKANETKSPSENKVNWPTNEHMKNHDVVITPDNNLNENIEETTPSIKKNDDVLVFFYPKKEKYVTTDMSNTKEPSNQTPTQSILTENESIGMEFQLNDKFSTNTPIKNKQSQNICTYLSKSECFEQKGLVYEYARRIPVSSSNNVPLICCVLPLESVTTKKPDISYIVNFPSSNKKKNRFKRSDALDALSQREFLLRQRFPTVQNLKQLPTQQSKIVAPAEDDYIDPYWNIKNTKFQNKPKVESSKYDDYSEDYEYADEVPRPGLIGLYSDHVKSPSSWTTGGNKGFSYGGTDDYIDEEEDDYSFGYSTVDPRKGEKTQRPKLKRPQKLTTSSGEVYYDAESQTINFQSNPDFQVFQGFKLLNLFRNKNSIPDKNSNRFTDDDRSTETVLVGSAEDEVFDEDQLFDGCGKAKKTIERGSQGGEAANGSHPWLALVVLTERRHNVLCYATLVHPRAAVTVADCVHGTSPDDITVIAGLWNLEDRSRAKNRVATVHVHPRYKPGNVAHNLAVLHWMRPLALNINVQPACLSEPQVGDDCKFFGWGGLDQGIHQARSRWQRVSIKTCTGTKQSSGAFCVSTPRGTVTGMGGPLICDIDGHSSVVGVVTSRDNGYVLTPVRTWVMQAEHLLRGD